MKFTYVAAILCFSLSISSCCCKKGCFSYLDLRLYNFKASDLDTVIIKNYKKNTNILINSIQQSAVPSSDSTYYYIPFFDVKPDSNDIVIVLPIPNRLYYIDSFRISQSVCNACFVGNDYYKSIS